MKNNFKTLSAKYFFENYATAVKNYKHKMRGVDGNLKPIEFSKEDKIEIRKAFKKFTNDFLKNI